MVMSTVHTLIFFFFFFFSLDPILKENEFEKFYFKKPNIATHKNIAKIGRTLITWRKIGVLEIFIIQNFHCIDINIDWLKILETRYSLFFFQKRKEKKEEDTQYLFLEIGELDLS